MLCSEPSHHNKFIKGTNCARDISNFSVVRDLVLGSRDFMTTKERTNEGTEERGNEGTKEQKYKRTSERRSEGTKNERGNESTKERVNQGTRERRTNEGTKE